MGKRWMIISTCVLALSLVTSTAFAKSDNAHGSNKNVEEAGESKSNSDGSNLGKDAKEAKDDSQVTVTSDTYEEGRGHNGYKGLLNAIENVKDKPAGAVIADLLMTKYEAVLTDEMKAKLEAIKEKAVALSAYAELIEEKGSVTDAVYVHKEAIMADLANVESYKKLGKLYDKMGKKGVKLYVNGEEPSVEVAPFIKEGSTLVPFRAISETLQAKVSWNEGERSVTVIRGKTTVKLFIDSKIAYVNNVEFTLEVPATIIDGNTVVPARFISESLQANVDWEPETESVIIYEKTK